MAEEPKNPVAKIDAGVQVPNTAQVQAEADAANAVAAAEAAIASGDVGAMQRAAGDVQAAAAANMAAGAVASNLDGAIAAAQTQQTITSNTPAVINAAVEKGVITTAQGEEIKKMAAEQTVAPSVTAPTQVEQSFVSNVPAPEATFTGQVAADKAAAAKTSGRTAA